MISGGDKGIKGEGWWYGSWGGSQGPLAMNKEAERKQQVEDDTQDERWGVLITEARLCLKPTEEKRKGEWEPRENVPGKKKKPHIQRKWKRALYQ